MTGRSPRPARYTSASGTFVGQAICSGERKQVPPQFLVDIVLHVGHRVSQGAHVQRITGLAADLLSHAGENLTRGVLVTCMIQLDAPADADHRRLWFGHWQPVLSVQRNILTATDTADLLFVDSGWRHGH